MMRALLACTWAIVICADVARAADLEAGVAVVDITPPKGYRMSGYFYERLNTGTHDPLLAKAIVFRQGNEQVALVFCDLIGLSRPVSSRARELAAKKTNIPVERILISATHSHTGPLYHGVLRDYFHENAMAKLGKDPHEVIDYPAQLVDKLATAIQAAQKSVEPVELLTGVTQQQGLSFNRRFHMKDGTVVFNPGKLNPNIDRVAGPTDPDVGMVRIRRRNKEQDIAFLTVFAMHLDTVGGTEYSADYPFYLARTLQPVLGNTCISLFGAGTCGDINHIDVTNPNPQGGQLEAARIGTALGRTVVLALPGLSKVESPRLGAAKTVVEAPLQQYGPKDIGWAKENLILVGTNKLPFLKQVEACKILSLQKTGGTNLPMEVQAFRLSDEAAIVGLPGEIFVELGLEIKKASPFSTTLVVELCNDAPGYVPTKKAFAEGSYETLNSRVKPGGGEMLVKAAVGLLTDLKQSSSPR
jgi:hypothetical protein